MAKKNKNGFVIYENIEETIITTVGKELQLIDDLFDGVTPSEEKYMRYESSNEYIRIKISKPAIIWH